MHTGVQFHPVRLPHNAPPPHPSSRNGTQNITWWSKDALPGSSSLPAACDPRFCARRGPTALPFPPATPQAPESPCSPPSAVLWPNLTSRSSSAYGISSAAPPRQRGKTSQVPASAMVLGPRGAPLTNAARCLRPRPRHSGFKASRGSIAWPAAPQRFAWRLTTHGSRRKWWLASLGTCTRPHSTSLPGAHRGREPGYPPHRTGRALFASGSSLRS